MTGVDGCRVESHRGPCFNPLFIGADAVTRCCETIRRGCHPPGFNPLFIGADAVTINGPASLPVAVVLAFQSPVYRGGCCDCDRGAAMEGLTLWFQSPVYRGGCCDSAPAARRRAAVPACFNPLFIGADAVTQPLRPGRHDGHLRFQSPVYRGGCCDPQGAALMTATAAALFQSPVYRGGCCDDPPAWPPYRGMPPRFQSPVYRGGCCDNRPRRPRRRRTRSCRFNPLFIGADAVTWSTARHRCRWRWCFNPLFIGADAVT